MTSLLVALPAAGLAQAQVHLSCVGTLVEARGSAERKRTTASLRFSLAVEAEAASSDAALAQLQGHLSAVRSSLQTLQVRELQVSSPSTTWQRPASRTGPKRVVASLQVSGQLAPARLQALVRGVGSLPGVRLAPVATEADRPGDRAARAKLLRAAYQDALAQGLELAGAMGLKGVLKPIEVLLEGGSRPGLKMAMAAEAAPFDPAELGAPVDRLSLQVRFCAR
ncbi:SIMPL domain-containing protein [Synechococcus sp. CBW1108]|uniref:SIMPL domain-containing protein n=1 Tax=Synechococcus sp. CBW1108 TaxID=1353147 RepID=UPI001E3B6684|nr:SIMPL domain-containing protein [Synechococcus sp. CBW1108]